MADFHIWATYLIIAVTVIGYVSEKWPIEAVALASLAAFLAVFTIFPFASADGRQIGPDLLISGFANPALATVLALLIVGQGLFATDAMDRPARIVAKIGGPSGTVALLVTLSAAAILSAILNNTPVVVIFIPILTVLAAQRNFPVSKALMPLSFLSILGGMTTLIGSSTNLLVAGIARDYGIEIGFFTMTVPGLALLVAGGIYVLFVMPRFLDRLSPEGGNDVRHAAGAQFIADILITANHPFRGETARGGLFPGLKELMPRVVIRRGMTFFPPFDDLTLSEGDRLVITSTKRAIMRALALGSATVSPAGESTGRPAEDSNSVPGPDYHLAEAVIAPGSRHAGRTVKNAGIETMYGLDVIGVQRKSRMGRLPMREIRLEPGDTVLVGGTDAALHEMRNAHDLLLLEWSTEAVPQTRKAWIAFLIFAGVVLVAASGIVPIVATAIIGAFAMIATGCLSLQQATRAFDRQIFLLVGASIAAAHALSETGGATMIAHAYVAAMGGQKPALVLSGMFLVIAILTNFLSHTPTAVLFTPIAIGIADGIGAPREAFVVAVIFAANACFATPISYQTNLLVMGPGRYSFSTFLKAGTPLVLIIWLTFSIAGSWYYGVR